MKPPVMLSISSFFSAWGDRMWSFAVGLYLIKLTPGSLQLAAVYGLVMTVTAVLFGPVIGDWVDQNGRLKVVRLTLLVQNSIVILCALVILLYLEISLDAKVQKFLQGVIILLGSLANLAGQGEKISVTKDWVVVVCSGRKDLLATTNAWLRRIDLSVAILAPMAVGFLMTVISDIAGIIFICSWNSVSVFAEYFLLLRVYKSVPILANKSFRDADSKPTGETVVTRNFNNWNFLQRFKMVLVGWKVYQRQTVVLAGVSLAMLYLTVLGFNSITTGYAYSQNLSELYVSICFGLGSLLGIGGTFLFPLLRRKFGLARTGLWGHSLQLTSLLLCVASIWVPGSPSEMLNSAIPIFNSSIASTKSTLMFSTTHLAYVGSPAPSPNTSMHTTSIKQSNNELLSYYPSSQVSIILLMCGIVLSRAGLWITDLTITQLYQENVPEDERGVVGGVQYSFNMLLELLQFILVIIMPRPYQYGYLILLSVFAVFSGAVIYVLFFVKHHKNITALTQLEEVDDFADDNGENVT